MNISLMSDHELEQMYRNCVDAVVNNKLTRERAVGLISAINAVWQQRVSEAIAGTYKAESPEQGVLKTIGYQVGNNGVSLAKRHSLLDFVMTGQLPFVGSPAHMLEWGEPRSRTRYQKLHRVLTVLHSSAKTLGYMEKAEGDWFRDLEYIEQVWRGQVR